MTQSKFFKITLKCLLLFHNKAKGYSCIIRYQSVSIPQKIFIIIKRKKSSTVYQSFPKHHLCFYKCPCCFQYHFKSHVMCSIVICTAYLYFNRELVVLKYIYLSNITGSVLCILKKLFYVFRTL